MVPHLLFKPMMMVFVLLWRQSNQHLCVSARQAPAACGTDDLICTSFSGVMQAVQEIGAICKSKKVFFHTDAAQAVGKVPLDVNKMNIDLMSISGHKVYGPKGVGALFIRRRPRVRVEPVQSGGGQERGMRSGTVPTPLVVGLGNS